ncbi:unnamed protein product [Phyllotreta striolata]|uniref:Gustatory receptor n=1 Tax=Phyllotreta striolata TaxID=444603 RepID=A0A9N9TJK6_PHYSR|nr:unnamed protein product [Phyllotreta striolata]
MTERQVTEIDDVWIISKGSRRYDMDESKSTWATLPIVRIVQKSSEIFAVTAPNLYDYEGASLLYVAYAIVVCLSQLTASALSTYVHWTKRSSGMSMTSNVLFTIVRLQLALTNVTSIVTLVLVKRRRLVGKTRRLGNVERTLQANFQRTIDYKPTVLTAQLGLFIGLILCIGIFDVYVTASSLQYDAFDAAIHSSYRLQVFIVALTTAQVRCCCARIQAAVEFANERMRDTLRTVAGEATFFLRRYDELCDAVDAVSDVYGAAMLMIVGCVVANLLAGSSALLKVLTVVRRDDALLLTSLFGIVEYAVISVMLAVPCGNASNEARKTCLVSYKILLGFQGSSRFGRCKNVKEELLLLAEHVRARNVRFSTGFFPVDYNVLFLILGSVATYLIIILQFQ